MAFHPDGRRRVFGHTWNLNQEVETYSSPSTFTTGRSADVPSTQVTLLLGLTWLQCSLSNPFVIDGQTDGLVLQEHCRTFKCVAGLALSSLRWLAVVSARRHLIVRSSITPSVLLLTGCSAVR